jgi:hypothetical protein
MVQTAHVERCRMVVQRLPTPPSELLKLEVSSFDTPLLENSTTVLTLSLGFTQGTPCQCDH